MANIENLENILKEQNDFLANLNNDLDNLNETLEKLKKQRGGLEENLEKLKKVSSSAKNIIDDIKGIFRDNKVNMDDIDRVNEIAINTKKIKRIISNLRAVNTKIEKAENDIKRTKEGIAILILSIEDTKMQITYQKQYLKLCTTSEEE